ncbi:MAG: hypothetical protein LBN98_03755 [Prevotellaceae bacterium]|nr:hypothetical protein [Prevotellaceae bacterium]
MDTSHRRIKQAALPALGRPPCQPWAGRPASLGQAALPALGRPPCQPWVGRPASLG